MGLHVDCGVISSPAHVLGDDVLLVALDACHDSASCQSVLHMVECCCCIYILCLATAPRSVVHHAVPVLLCIYLAVPNLTVVGWCVYQLVCAAEGCADIHLSWDDACEMLLQRESLSFSLQQSKDPDSKSACASSS